MSFIIGGGPKAALSSLKLELIQSAVTFEFAASAVMNKSTHSERWIKKMDNNR